MHSLLNKLFFRGDKVAVHLHIVPPNYVCNELSGLYHFNKRVNLGLDKELAPGDREALMSVMTTFAMLKALARDCVVV